LPTITIKTGGAYHYVEFSVGQTLREILDSTSFRVRSGCRGTGACGLCRVQIKAGGHSELNPVELIYLSEDQIQAGERLACQVTPNDDMEVSFPGRKQVSPWRAIPGPSPAFSSVASHPASASKDLYGAAVDLGTTHISVSFYNLSTGLWLAGRRGLNPQGAYGSDVMARVIAADESSRAAKELKKLVVDAIGAAIMDIAVNEGIGSEQVAKVTLAANTAMLALMSGRNFHLLTQPAYWMQYIDCLPEDTSELCSEWRIDPKAVIQILPPLSGFVGSDLLTGVFATRLTEKAPGALFIDFGTNSEIAFWDGESLWVTSAAGGPAFEGCGIGCGIPCEPGAVYHVGWPGQAVWFENPASGDHRPMVFKNNVLGLELEFRTIDNENPLGFCGSGIVDLIACLLESGKLTRIGRFSPEVPNGVIEVLNGSGKPLLLRKRDVDIFQRAKAAIFAGVMVLLDRASFKPKELSHVFVGGAFGHFLNRKNASAIGLLPDLDLDSVELLGNTALRGCEELLMTTGSAEIIAGLRKKAKIVNMGHCEEFEDFFIEGLHLGRWAN
jgi:uncharacterized 2Fe-2S/4Fe-4S cluster protein (DUF4445 family)